MSESLEKQLLAEVERAEPEFRIGVEREVRRLMEAGGGTVEGLIGLLKHPEEQMRRLACEYLCELRERRALPGLIAALEDEDDSVRRAAVHALQQLRGGRAFKALARVLRSHPDPETRFRAAYALSWMYDRRGIPPLLDALSNLGEEAPIRGQAAEGLAYLSARSAIPVLMRGLDDPAPEVRFWCAFALGQLGEKRALSKLHRLAETDQAVIPCFWSVAKEASDAIRCIRDLPELEESEEEDQAAATHVGVEGEEPVLE